jgi:hypothetical protein
LKRPGIGKRHAYSQNHAANKGGDRLAHSSLLNLFGAQGF